MSKPFTNPFFNASNTDLSKMFDMSKMTDMSKMFDMSKFADMSKIFGDCRMPQFDPEAAFALQRKNIEAFTALSQAAYESIQSLCHRQAESYRQIIEEITQTTQAILSCPTTESKAIKQAEASKAALEKYLANLRDASETIAKCNSQAFETVSARLNDSMSELRGIVKKTDCAA